MEKVLTKKEIINLLFKYMCIQFNSKKYSELDMTYQFIFQDIDNGYNIYFRILHGKAEFKEGVSDNPSITIYTPSNVWLDISGGFINPIWALVTNKYKIKGNLSCLGLLPKLLTNKILIPKNEVTISPLKVPKRILVILGSPRKHDGLTYFYLKSFLKGMTNENTEIKEIVLYEKTILQCSGCFHCWTIKPGKCIHKDDQAELNVELDNADLIVYAMPLYFDSMPGLVKTHLDRQIARQYPFMEGDGKLTKHPRRNYKKQNLILFSICGFPEIEQFSPLIQTFKAYARNESISFINNILLPGAMELFHNPTNQSVFNQKLTCLETAGKELVLKGRVSRKIVKEIAKIHTPIKKWRSGANFYWYDRILQNKEVNIFDNKTIIE